jgi:hypothetical protein
VDDKFVSLAEDVEAVTVAACGDTAFEVSTGNLELQLVRKFETINTTRIVANRINDFLIN